MAVKRTVLELYAGAGGAGRGLHDAGFEHVGFVEMDPAACAALRLNFPDSLVVESKVADVGADLWARWVGVFLLWASPPCQPWSTAGAMLGAADPRDGWGDVIAAVERVRPTWVIVENVRAAPVDRWCADLAAFYPVTEARFLNAADYGVPQIRKRQIVVAGPSRFPWPEQTHADPEMPFLSAVLPRWVSIRDALQLTGGLIPGNGGNRPAIRSPDKPAHTVSASCPMYALRPAPTISTAASQGVSSAASRRLLERMIGKRRLSLAECATLQSFPPDHAFVGRVEDQYRQIGNAVPPLLAKHLAAGLSLPPPPGDLP